MPNAPKRFSLTPPRDRHRERDEFKGTAQERGYDHTWRKLRAAHVAEHPLCIECKREGIVQPVEVVDHRIPFDGPDDPLRLDPTNLDSLCRRHHTLKTYRDKRGG